MSAVDLTPRLRAAADYMEAHGWTQGTEKDDDGHVCLTGAIRYCAPQTGDEYLIREVLRARGRAEDWNDAAARDAGEVVGYLRTAEITDADLAAVFGPQWEAVVALVRRAATLTPQGVEALAAARAAAGAAAGAAAWAAAWALVVRDLIGQGGFTQAHYDTLTRPWASVIGPVHPDDADIREDVLDVTEYVNILDRLTKGRELPEGCDRWGLKATDFAGRTHGGFQWPAHGWVEADLPPGHEFTTDDPCPAFRGDGLCVALTYEGMASGGHRALCLLLVAYADADLLGGNGDKVRLRRVFVVERLDGEQVLRDHGASANLRGADLRAAYLGGAYLRGANLCYADLRGAYLRAAYLGGANLHGADLGGAYLRAAYLVGADLRGADLRGANLRGADLRGAYLRAAYLVGADLRGAYLGGADLRGAYLGGAVASSHTVWPDRFNPEAAGVIVR